MKRGIDNYSIGDGEPTSTIAEAGANHNRELDTAKIEKPWW
jgi:sialic acid synthase SpsE